MLKSLNEFDKLEIGGVIQGLLGTKTDRDNSFIGLYFRGKTNIESLLALKNAKDVQAISMVARGLFELAVDMALIDVIADAPSKILAFSDVERLRAATRIANFELVHPSAAVDAAEYAAFIARDSARINAVQNTIWPGVNNLRHWSGMTLSDRVHRLGAPFDEMYEVDYPRLSWYVHSAGLTGFLDLKAETFNLLAAKHNYFAGECYIVLLTAIIDEFGIEKADAEIKNKLDRAKRLPFTDSPANEAVRKQEFLG